MFIDELGKFITRDHNYFFQPTIGLLYALFAILYIAATFLTRPRPLSTEERHINVLYLLEESVKYDLDASERHQTITLLDGCDPRHPLTKLLKAMVAHLPASAPAPTRA